jgi:hypothetical protein
MSGRSIGLAKSEITKMKTSASLAGIRGTITRNFRKCEEGMYAITIGKTSNRSQRGW